MSDAETTTPTPAPTPSAKDAHAERPTGAAGARKYSSPITKQTYLESDGGYVWDKRDPSVKWPGSLG